LSLKAKKYRDY
jgi:hypothetical protein